MLGKFFDWLDHRTGFGKMRDALLIEHIPGGAKWRYVWGSCLASVFMIQLVTGVLLMTAYSPGDSTAWGSVYFIQYEMDFGWLIRGLHHFGSQTMVVLLGLHMLQVVIAGAHLPPREVNWWLGLGLLSVVLGLSLTGYLLPWDQKGFWATQVATNIMGHLPILGSFLQKVVVGGPEYGHQTLTHFYALHVGILPPLMIVLIMAHLAVFRRHGVTAPANAQGEGMFWPAQAFKDMVVSLLIFGIMLGLVVFGGHGHKIDTPMVPGKEPGLYEKLAQAGRAGLGANLDAPADPATESYPARPEWYFLFLFQLLKYFKGDQEIIGTAFIPLGVGILLFLLPLLGYGRLRKFGHFFGVLVVVVLLAGAGVLTFLAIADDSVKPIFWLGGTDNAKKLAKEFTKAEAEAKRAVNLARDGIPDEGARELLRRDPLTKGPRLFEMNCAPCHRFSAQKDQPGFKGVDDPKVKYKVSDLGGYASQAWIRGLLHNPKDNKYFGLTKFKGMIGWRKEIDTERKDMNKEEIAKQEADLDLVAQWLADQAKPKELRYKELSKKQIDKARMLFTDEEKGFGCVRCHRFEGKGKKVGPDLTGYGSQDWIRLMIMNPSHETRYGAKNEMPPFRNADGPGAEVLLKEFQDLQEKNELKTSIIPLSDIDRELIIRWLTRDYRVVFGGRTISGPQPK